MNSWKPNFCQASTHFIRHTAFSPVSCRVQSDAEICLKLKFWSLMPVDRTYTAHSVFFSFFPFFNGGTGVQLANMWVLNTWALTTGWPIRAEMEGWGSLKTIHCGISIKTKYKYFLHSLFFAAYPVQGCENLFQLMWQRRGASWAVLQFITGLTNNHTHLQTI